MKYIEINQISYPILSKNQILKNNTSTYTFEIPNGKLELISNLGANNIQGYFTQNDVTQEIDSYRVQELYNELLSKKDTDQYTKEWIHKNWDKTLENISNSKILETIQWAFNENDIVKLRQLHESGKHRKKIESLLEMGDFYREREYWAKGMYTELELMKIVFFSSRKLIENYLQNSSIFTKENILKFCGIHVTGSGVDEAFWDFKKGFNRYFYSIITELTLKELEPLVSNSQVDVKNFESFIEKHKSNAFLYGIEESKKILDSNIVGRNTSQKIFLGEFDDILTLYLYNSLQEFLRNKYFPEKIINTSDALSIVDSFSEKKKIKEYYVTEGNSAPVILWLSKNIPYKNLEDIYWSNSISDLEENYHNELIRKIKDNISIESDRYLLDAIVAHPKEAAKVYDETLDIEAFVEEYVLDEQ